MGVLTLWHDLYRCREAGGFPSTTKQTAVVDRAAEAGWDDVREPAAFALVQYQAGMDCHEDDVAGGIRGWTAELPWERHSFVFEEAGARGLPVVVHLAGGYQGARTVDLHLGTPREAHRAR